MRALHALRVSLPGSPAGTGWRRILSTAALTTLAVVGPAAAAYATDSVVSDRPVIADSADHGLLVRAHAAAHGLYPGARQDVSLLVTNLGAESVTTGSVRNTNLVVTDSVGHCGRNNFTMQRTTASATVIPAGATRRLDLPGAITMKSSAGDGCQGATVRLDMNVDAT